MSLKRKSVFQAVPSSPLAPANEWGIVDTSAHLHSRTRKRFRNDRPSDAVVYASMLTSSSENTLRWIFSAQQQQNSTPAVDNTAMDSAMDSEPTLPPPETVDPRQQTLHRFFQPTPQPSSPFRPSRQALAPRANETGLAQEDLLRRKAFDRMNSVDSSSDSETTSPGCNQPDVDMDVDMD
ncbi:hypothetical protein NUU61_005170 [Penicillium alfredii]|uniref:Uncharacterized protein n=1 Tax=Penicillium alfredii TaxID=1506179 RepID=A0A9W9F926_9EURO|nr:uncharacterized protein NUU61_005170 [Penicillium alfredii]KAJ5095814.1 hypothetical protein NUU61_005170 [Penicillium alfredii]